MAAWNSVVANKQTNKNQEKKMKKNEGVQGGFIKDQGFNIIH